MSVTKNTWTNTFNHYLENKIKIELDTFFFFFFFFWNLEQDFESDKNFKFTLFQSWFEYPFWLQDKENWKINSSTRITVICFPGRSKTTQTSQQLFSSSQKAIKLQKHSLKICTCCVYLCMNHSSGQKGILDKVHTVA